MTDRDLRPVDEPDHDHGHRDIDWPEIDADALDRPLRVQRRWRRGRIVSDVEHYDPRRS